MGGGFSSNGEPGTAGGSRGTSCNSVLMGGAAVAAAGTDPRPDEDRTCIGLARINQHQQQQQQQQEAGNEGVGGAAAEAGDGKRRKVASNHVSSLMSGDRIKALHARLHVEHRADIKRQPGHSLQQRIDRAYKEGDINEAVHAVSHEARLAGNIAAHAAPGAFGTQLLDDGDNGGGDVVVPQSEDEDDLDKDLF